MQLVLQGSYHNLGRFFDRISTMTRLMSVSDLAIKAVPKTTGDGGGTITATCIATTFVFKKDMSADDSKTAAATTAAPATGGKK